LNIPDSCAFLFYITDSKTYVSVIDWLMGGQADFTLQIGAFLYSLFGSITRTFETIGIAAAQAAFWFLSFHLIIRLILFWPNRISIAFFGVILFYINFYYFFVLV
jgi:hypothetical protein